MSKKYQFDLEEIIAMREAMADYSHRLKPPADASPNRVRNYRVAVALFEQFRDDARLYREQP